MGRREVHLAVDFDFVSVLCIVLRVGIIIVVAENRLIGTIRDSMF